MLGLPRSLRVVPAMALVAAITALAAQPARAASPDEAQRKNTARGLADYANQLVAAGNYEGAITAFKQADQIYHAPTLVLALARANAKAHHLLAARDLYRQIIGEQLAADAPEEFRSAQRASKEEVAVVITSIPTLEVRVRGTGAGPAIQVAVDDKPLTQGEPTDVDPGKHLIKATGAGDPRTRALHRARRHRRRGRRPGPRRGDDRGGHHAPQRVRDPRELRLQRLPAERHVEGLEHQRRGGRLDRGLRHRGHRRGRRYRSHRPQRHGQAERQRFGWAGVAVSSRHLLS
jgi:hypothetical protein